MSVTTQRAVPLPTVFGDVVVEQHDEAARRNLPPLGQEVGIASVWVVFYVVVACAAAIHYVFHVWRLKQKDRFQFGTQAEESARADSLERLRKSARGSSDRRLSF